MNIESFARDYQPFEKAKRIVQFLYYALAFQSLSVLQGRENYITTNLPNENFNPIWSVAWMKLLDPTTGANIIIFFFVASSIIGALFQRYLVSRIMAFLGVLQLHALYSLFVQVDHHWYPWLYTTFLLMFLPKTSDKNDNGLEDRKKFLFTFFCLQIAIFGIYSLVGVGRIYGSIRDIQAGGVSAFAPEALALHVAHWLSQNNTSSLLGPFIIQHPLVGWPFFAGSIYLLLFSLWAVFKPSLHRIWALGLIIYHLAIYLTMNMLFISPSILLIFLFFDSPFRKKGVSFREMVLDLPILGLALRKLYPKISRRV